jgi:hypothetical protein
MPYPTAFLRGKYSGKGFKKFQSEELNPGPQQKKVQRIRQYTILFARLSIGCPVAKLGRYLLIGYNDKI